MDYCFRSMLGICYIYTSKQLINYVQYSVEEEEEHLYIQLISLERFVNMETSKKKVLYFALTCVVVISWNQANSNKITCVTTMTARATNDNLGRQ